MQKAVFWLILSILVTYVGFQIFRNDYTQTKCFSKEEAGFTNSASLSKAGDKISLDFRLSLSKAPKPLNFDAFVFINNKLHLVESKIYLSCDKNITRSIPLDVNPTDSISVVFTRHIQDKKSENVEAIRAGQDFRVQSRLLSSIIVVKSGDISTNDTFSDIKTETSTKPVFSTVTEMSSPTNEFGGVTRQKIPRDSLAIIVFNDTKRTVVYNLVCLQDEQQIFFSNGLPLVKLKIEPKRYARLQLKSDKLVMNELALVHCYSIFSRTLTSKKPIEVSPIWATFVVQGNLK
jgi:hypothetical protein